MGQGGEEEIQRIVWVVKKLILMNSKSKSTAGRKLWISALMDMNKCKRIPFARKS